MIQKTFFFLSSSLKARRSSTILLSLSFSRESSMSECVEKNVESSYVDLGRSTVACRVDYLHRDVHFSGEENRHLSCLSFYLLVISVVFFISRYSCTLFLHRLISKSAFVGKKM